MAQPTRWYPFALSLSALAFRDLEPNSWHLTSEMIQEDMKVMEPQSDPRGVPPERSLR